jgi:hypothetical protein
MSDGEALDQKGGNASRLEQALCCCGHRVSHAGRQGKPGSRSYRQNVPRCPASTLYQNGWTITSSTMGMVASVGISFMSR